MIRLFAKFIEQVKNILRRSLHTPYFLQGAGKIACCEQFCRLLSVLMDECVRFFQQSERTVIARAA